MKSVDQLRTQPGFRIIKEAEDHVTGWVVLNNDKKHEDLITVFSWGGGWEHVSVSFRGRAPTWDEMCEVKDMFFEKDETAMPVPQFVKGSRCCLDLWRKR